MRRDWLKLIESFSRLKILVIGDCIVDHFIWGTVSRISPEAPVPVVNVTREELLLGGSANVLRNIVSLGARGGLCGIIGNDAMGEALLGLMDTLPAATDGLVRGGRPTTVKTRVVAQGQQVVRYDREATGPPSASALEGMVDFLRNHLAGFDAVVVSDYAKGVINGELMARLTFLLAEARKQSGRPLPLVIDPKPANTDCYSGSTMVTPNHHEAELMSGRVILTQEDLLPAARAIRDRISCQAVLITRGEAGMALLAEDQLTTIPTMAKEVFDVTGAGDTVAATLALGLAAGIPVGEAALLANYAAGIVVGKIGTASVTGQELAACFPNYDPREISHE